VEAFLPYEEEACRDEAEMRDEPDCGEEFTGEEAKSPKPLTSLRGYLKTGIGEEPNAKKKCNVERVGAPKPQSSLRVSLKGMFGRASRKVAKTFSYQSLSKGESKAIPGEESNDISPGESENVSDGEPKDISNGYLAAGESPTSMIWVTRE
jgi:hypothetical protein